MTPPADIRYLYPSTVPGPPPPSTPPDEPIRDRLMLSAQTGLAFMLGLTTAFLVTIWSGPQPLDMLRGQIRAGKASADDICLQLKATAPATWQRDARPPILPRRP